MHSSRIQQVYGFVVCLIAIVVMLTNAQSVLNAAIARSDPVHAVGDQQGASLTSFEAFQATYRQPAGVRQAGAPATPDTMTTANLRQRYEVLREDRIARVMFDTRKQLVVNGLMLVVGILLFATHWRWLRARGAPDAAPAAT